ncbi:MAG: hypothetical protein JW818_22340 [Pirellulales bacterium]|nr:hypothetical protein [Pirellulales bacterium]
MRAQLVRQVVCLAVGLALIMICSGCWPRPRHGLIVRGDFALELNRIPWLKSRGADYNEALAEPGGECIESVCHTNPAPAAPAVCAPGPNAMGQGGAVAQTGYHNEPRFFPVPTRPAFAPREGESGLMPPHGPMTLPRSLDFVPDCAVPLQPECPPDEPAPQREVIPAPSPSKQQASSRSAPAWIFQPPTETETASGDPSRTARGSWASRRS